MDFLQQISLCCSGSSVDCRWISASPWSSTGCGGQPASPCSSMGCEHLLHHWPWCMQSCFSPSLLPAICVLCVPRLSVSLSHTHARMRQLWRTFYPFSLLQRMLPASVVGSAFASDGSVVPGGTICVHHGAAPSLRWQSCYLLPTPCHGDLVHLPRQV